MRDTIIRFYGDEEPFFKDKCWVEKDGSLFGVYTYEQAIRLVSAQLEDNPNAVVTGQGYTIGKNTQYPGCRHPDNRFVVRDDHGAVVAKSRCLAWLWRHWYGAVQYSIHGNTPPAQAVIAPTGGRLWADYADQGKSGRAEALNLAGDIYWPVSDDEIDEVAGWYEEVTQRPLTPISDRRYEYLVHCQRCEVNMRLGDWSFPLRMDGSALCVVCEEKEVQCS